MDDSRAKDLLGKILDDGDITRQLFVPANDPATDRLSEWENLRDELMCHNRYFPEKTIDLDRLEALLSPLTRDADELPTTWYRARIRAGDVPYRVLEVHPYRLQRSLTQGLFQLGIFIASAFPEFYEDGQLVECKFRGEGHKYTVCRGLRGERAKEVLELAFNHRQLLSLCDVLQRPHCICCSDRFVKVDDAAKDALNQFGVSCQAQKTLHARYANTEEILCLKPSEQIFFEILVDYRDERRPVRHGERSRANIANDKRRTPGRVRGQSFEQWSQLSLCKSSHAFRTTSIEIVH